MDSVMAMTAIFRKEHITTTMPPKAPHSTPCRMITTGRGTAAASRRMRASR